eukprot:1242513-Amphidinium_carterae.1
MIGANSAVKQGYKGFPRSAGYGTPISRLSVGSHALSAVDFSEQCQGTQDNCRHCNCKDGSCCQLIMVLLALVTKINFMLACSTCETTCRAKATTC